MAVLEVLHRFVGGGVVGVAREVQSAVVGGRDVEGDGGDVFAVGLALVEVLDLVDGWSGSGGAGSWWSRSDGAGSWVGGVASGGSCHGGAGHEGESRGEDEGLHCGGGLMVVDVLVIESRMWKLEMRMTDVRVVVLSRCV